MFHRRCVLISAECKYRSSAAASAALAAAVAPAKAATHLSEVRQIKFPVTRAICDRHTRVVCSGDPSKREYRSNGGSGGGGGGGCLATNDELL